MANGAYGDFYQAVWSHYAAHGRHDLPWRLPDETGRFEPYRILVSELMLQQTQVSRVLPKYQQFLELFPTIETLAAASLGSVLVSWQGLGYNRRAKYLWETAQEITGQLAGNFPQSVAELDQLPGVGRNTAGAIVAYAYNRPAVFLETNIRTVFIHHFFADMTGVSDHMIAELVAATLPASKGLVPWPVAGDGCSPPIRHWYWALMDYGSYLKRTIGNLSRASATYSKQPLFGGSLRQLRGNVVRLLAAGAMPSEQLARALHDERAMAVMAGLQAEGLIVYRDGRYELP